MTCSTTNPLVEHVARAINKRIFDRDIDTCKGDARAAIRATLEYLRDHVSEGMLTALHRDVRILCTPAQWEASIVNDKETLASVLSTAIDELEAMK